MVRTEKTDVFGEKPAAVPLCPLQIPHTPDWYSTWISVMRERRLSAEANLVSSKRGSHV
jgi:hypothetical protein